MAEYIEREAALKKLCEGCCEYDSENTECSCNEQLAILKIHAADVVPVVHGRWEHLEDGCFDLWRCSACGDEWTFEYDPTDSETKVNYCPNCGAKMEDGE